MDHRSWPWKKKSSDKSAAEKAVALLDSANSAKDQISVEKHSHFTGLEEKVKMYEETVQSLEERVEELNEKLLSTDAEITTKEDMVKQHTKVAEEAVSGWEKAEAEALALQGHLESVTLEKLAAEDRASHLDDALKECMRQIRNLKEEHEKNLQEVVLVKTKHWEKIKEEYESKIVALDQELLRSAADNAALSRSLQERSNMVIKLSEEKFEAEAEIELLKSNIKSCEKEISRLKYEVHVVSKELDIRNEEKNMSVRSAQVANKQHIEGVKKITKLEAECQRLRGLVRKKLPGPAALAQMRVEVENLGRDYGDPHLKRSPVKPSSSHPSPMPEFCFHNVQNVQRENEFLTERLYAMEEETKMLKEALAKRNSELQALRSTFDKTASKLLLLEAQMQVYNASNPPSLTSVSEVGNDEDTSVTGSWAASLVSELSWFKKETDFDKPVNSNHLELMDDFLEMEKLANNPDGTIYTTDSSVKNHADGSSNGGLVDNGKNQLSVPLALRQESSGEQLRCVKLQSRILSVIEKTTEADNVDRVLEEIKLVLQEAHDVGDHDNVSSLSEEKHSPNVVLLDTTTSADVVSAVSESNSKVTTGAVQTSGLDLEASLSNIYEFVLLLGKEAVSEHEISEDGQGLITQTIEEFSETYHKFLNKDSDLLNLVDDLSRVFAKARQLKFNVLDKGSDSEITIPDCIDKVVLPEEGTFLRDSSRNGYRSGRANIIDHTSNPYVSDDSNTNSDYEASTSVGVFMEDHEKLRSENEKLAKDLAMSNRNLETMKSQVQELAQTLVEVKSQLASSQMSYSLAETQLKCMAESYRSLEERAEELQREVDLLRAKMDSLNNDLHEEKKSHQDMLAKNKELEEYLLRMESSSSRADTELKSKQEHDLAAAAEKLAECQETIFLLGKQLKALHPQTEVPPAHPNLQDIVREDVDTISTTITTGNQSPLHSYLVLPSPSESESNFMRSPISSKHPMHRATLSGSSVTSSDRQLRGIGRLFSSKG